jgi:hypothetical protein
MAVLHKATVQASLKELETYYEQLKQVLQGKDLSERDALMYVSQPSRFQLVQINNDALLDAVGHFKVSVDSLRRLNAKSIKPSKVPFFPPDEKPF